MSRCNSWKEAHLTKASTRGSRRFCSNGTVFHGTGRLQATASSHLWSSAVAHPCGRSTGCAVIGSCGCTPLIGHVEPPHDVVEYQVADAQTVGSTPDPGGIEGTWRGSSLYDGRSSAIQCTSGLLNFLSRSLVQSGCLFKLSHRDCSRLSLDRQALASTRMPRTYQEVDVR